MKHKLQNLLKHKLQWLLLLVVLLGVSQGVWAGDPYGKSWDVTFSGATSVTKSTNNADLGTLATSSSNALKISAWHSYWNKNGGNVCDTGEMWWNIDDGSYSKISKGGTNWNDDSNICHYKTSANTTIYSGTTVGQHTIHVNFNATGANWSNGGCGGSYYLPSSYGTSYSITFTVPGWSTTSSSKSFGSVNVGSNSSETVSLGTHYGASSEVTSSVSGTNYGDFEVTSVSATSVTVKFKPSAAGSRTATVTITDKYFKTYTLTVSGTGVAACTGPTVTTSSSSTPSYATATVSGTITNGTCTVKAAGICYALSTETTTPTISNSTKTVSYTSDTEFSTSLESLTPGKTYYFRAYATTDSETKYGTVQSFSTTACPNPETSDPSTDNVNYCKGAAATALTVTATGGVGSYTYQWQQRAKATDDWVNATDGTGATTASFTPSTSYYNGTQSANRYYRCVVTNKDVCTSNSVNSNSSGRIRTYAPTTAGSISDAGTFCQGEVGDVQTLTLSGQNATANVRWYVSSTSGFTPGTSTRTEVTAETYDAPISSTGTLYYKVNVKNGACATVTTDQAAVTVDPYPTITAQPTASQSVCVGSTASSISVTATGTGLSYQWQVGSENWSDWEGKTSSTLTFTGAIPYADTWHYRCKITASCGATIYSETHTITGVATASITSVTLTSSPVCKGQGLGATANGVVLGGGTGAWSSSNTSVATVNSSETTTTTVATPGAGTANIIYTITGGCGGTKSAQATLTVNPNNSVAGVTISLDKNNVCAGVSVQASKSGTPVVSPGATAQWYSSTAKATIDPSTGAITTNSGGTSNISYRVTGGCGSTVETSAQMLTIKSIPTLTPASSSVENFTPVRIGANEDVTWSVAEQASDSYLFEQTARKTKFKGTVGAGANKTFTVNGTGANGCAGSATVTVTKDNESCN